MRKIIGAYHGSRQETLEIIAKVEPVQTKVKDMQIRAADRILEKGVQGNLIAKVTEPRDAEGGQD